MADDVKAHEKTAATHAVAATNHAKAAVAHTKAAVNETQARGPTTAAHAHTTAAAQHAAAAAQHANVAAAHANAHEAKATHFDAPAKTQTQAAAAVMNARTANQHAALATQHAAIARRVQGPTQGIVRPLAVARPGIARPGIAPSAIARPVVRPGVASPFLPRVPGRPAAPAWGRPAAPAFGQPSWTSSIVNQEQWGAQPGYGYGYDGGYAPPAPYGGDPYYGDYGYGGGDDQAPPPPHHRHGGKQEKIRAWANRVIQAINSQDPTGFDNLVVVQTAVQAGNPAAIAINNLVMADPGVQQALATSAPANGSAAPAPPSPQTAADLMSDASGF
jgi:hypothetical protein